MVSTAVFVFAAVTPANGFVGGSLYARMGGKNYALITSLTFSITIGN